MRAKTMVATLVITAVVTTTIVALPQTALAENNGLTLETVNAALQSASGSLAPIDTSQSADIGSDGTIRIATEEQGDLIITLPNYRNAQTGTDGSQTYLSDNSAVSVRPTEGGAQTLLIATSVSAPTEYKFGVSNGYVTALANGSLLLLDRALSPVRIIAAPWALDANHKAVATSFVVNASHTEFTQIIAHRAEGVSYPVVADPIVVWLMGITVLCFIKGSYEARSLKGEPWYIWALGLSLACLPLP